MKFLGSQIAYLISVPEMRSNLRALVKYILMLVVLVLAFLAYKFLIAGKRRV